MSINKAIVVGNLGRDPEVRALTSGQNVANFSVRPRRGSRIEAASDRSGPNGTAWSLSGSSRITASACFRRIARGSGFARDHFRAGALGERAPDGAFHFPDAGQRASRAVGPSRSRASVSRCRNLGPGLKTYIRSSKADRHAILHVSQGEWPCLRTHCVALGTSVHSHV
jgi:hypothetical protein